MSDFDPYHKWLGIPPKDQPPNHYRLLGIELLESDPDVIDAAAEQRTSFVRQCATGPRMAESQKLLNEIATARLCLLNTEKRLAYDAGLATAVEPNLSGKLAVPTDMEPEWEEEEEAEPPQEVRAERRTRRPPPPARNMKGTNQPVKPVVLVCGGLGVIVLLVVLSLNRNGGAPPPGANAPSLGEASIAKANLPASSASVSPTPVSTPRPVPPQIASATTAGDKQATLNPEPSVNRLSQPFQKKDDEPNPSTSAAMPRTNDTTKTEVATSAPAPLTSIPVPATTETSSPIEDDLPSGYTSASTKMKFALIPAGTFMMGSPDSETSRQPHEGPQHSVRITQPFYMGVYEVTQGEYQSVMGSNPSSFPKNGKLKRKVSGMEADKLPVETVSWDNAQEFCRKLSFRDGQTYRLPTEAEWEYACRAGTTTPFHFGSTLNGDKGNVDGNSPYGATTKGKSLGRTTTVGAYAKNDFGLYDVHGNVWEWCEDVYDESAYGRRSGTTSDPKVTSGSTDRVVRGGSWNLVPRLARSADRVRTAPGGRNNSYGFRVVFSSVSTMPRATDTTKPKFAASDPAPLASIPVPTTTENVPTNGNDLPPSHTSASTGMMLTLIPAGTFQMGSPASEENRTPAEGPQHTVRITQPFYLGVYEVTQAVYESVMGTNPSSFSKTGTSSSNVSEMDTSKFPVETVSWNDAQEFCRKLSLKDGQTYRLPTEAEWEYAARANTTTPFHFGRTLNGDKANVDGNNPYGTTTKGNSLKRTTTVGAYGANAFGLYDMHGNVLEWCEDMFDSSAYGKRSGTTSDPKVTSGSEYRVLRGGSWLSNPRDARLAYRVRFTPGSRNYNFGFRVVFSSVRTP